MKILISIFFVVMIGILASKFKINIVYLEKEKNSFKMRFEIRIGLYLFGVIKIFGMKFKEDGMYFLSFRFPYNKLKIDKDSMKILKDFSIIDLLKSFHLRLDKLNLNLKIGSKDMILTVFSVFAISTFLSILSAKNRSQINLKNYYYKITPIYNTNLLSFQISTKISINTYNIIQALISANQSAKNRKQYRMHIKKVPLKL